MDPTPARTCFLIGHPVGHSLSPVIHKAAYCELGMDWHYGLMDVLPGDVGGVLSGIDGERVVGVNVTIPHKQEACEQVDRLTTTAAAVGAVNTVYRDGDDLVGENTDVAGFLAPLQQMERTDWTESSALIVGAGGAARAVAYALTQVLGLQKVVVTARREATARAIQGVDVVDWADRGSKLAAFDLIVNTTPVGMSPNTNASPLPESTRMTAEHVVYDLIYAPARTRLMMDAESAGARVIGGLPMLIGQAAEAFRIWTGRDMPVSTVEKAVRAHLQGTGSS